MNAKWEGEQPEKFIDPKDYKVAVSEPMLHECVEDLHALADECREWARTGFRPDEPFNSDPADVQREFKRLAKQLDEIAKRIGGANKAAEAARAATIVSPTYEQMRILLDDARDETHKALCRMDAAEAALVEVQEKCERLTKRLQERREVTLVGSGTDDAERAYEVGFRDARTIAELMVRNAAQSSLATDVGKIPLPPRGSRDNDH